MIVVAIIGILAAVAFPAYQTYTKKAKLAEVVLATAGVKAAMDICAQTVDSSATSCAGCLLTMKACQTLQARAMYCLQL